MYKYLTSRVNFYPSACKYSICQPYSVKTKPYGCTYGAVLTEYGLADGMVDKQEGIIVAFAVF